MNKQIVELIGSLENLGIDFYTIATFDDVVVARAEEKLEFRFPDDYANFLMSYGACSFGRYEVYGVTTQDLSRPAIPNAIWYTLELRKYSLPKNMLVIGSSDLYLVCIRSVCEGEWDIVRCYKSGTSISTKVEKIFESFNAYLCNLLAEAL